MPGLGLPVDLLIYFFAKVYCVGMSLPTMAIYDQSGS